MKKLYTVMAGQDHGGSRVIRVYADPFRANRFAMECAEYAASRPGKPRDQNHDDPDDEARHDADCELWFKALDKWNAAHPAAGYYCDMDYRFTVGTIDYDDELERKSEPDAVLVCRNRDAACVTPAKCRADGCESERLGEKMV